MVIINNTEAINTEELLRPLDVVNNYTGEGGQPMDLMDRFIDKTIHHNGIVYTIIGWSANFFMYRAEFVIEEPKFVLRSVSIQDPPDECYTIPITNEIVFID